MSAIAGFILSPVIAVVVGLLFTGISRKITARIHWRYGPPILQPVIDIMRYMSQTSVSHGFIFEFGLIFSLAGNLAVLLFIPLGGMSPLSASGGLLVILYLMLLSPLGAALSGGEGANPNISIGVSRKMFLALAYEVPLLMVLLAVMTQYNSISLVRAVEIQRNSVWAIISMPLSGAAFFLILPAMLGIKPFDQAGAGQEISSGTKAEYGGKFLAMYEINGALHEFVVIALFVNLFLGGAAEPFTFVLKMFMAFLPCLFVSAVFPRLRIEQAVKYLWGVPALLALAGLIAARF